MEITCQWQGKMAFNANLGAHQITMDAASPIGGDTGATPKQLLIAAICGCTGMDVAALMKKHKQDMKSFTIEASGDLTAKHPKVFQEIALKFKATGDIDSDKLLSAVHLSMTQYCGVSAMVNAVSPIRYIVELNGVSIGKGNAHFEITK
jgi:putative redox protein